MQRQLELQSQLKALQDDHLAHIATWLLAVEGAIGQSGLLADDSKESAQQLIEHTQLQEEIQKQQENMQKLTSFVAIVDEGSQDKQKQYAELDEMLSVIGEFRFLRKALEFFSTGSTFKASSIFQKISIRSNNRSSPHIFQANVGRQCVNGQRNVPLNLTASHNS